MHIDHAGNHRERRVQQIDRAEENDPGVDADQEVAGQGQDHQQHQQIAMTLAAAGDQQGQRIGQQQADQSGGRGDQEGTAEDFGIDPVAEEEAVGFQGQGELAILHGRHQSSEVTWLLERGTDHQQRRDEKENHQKQGWRQADQPFGQRLSSTDRTAACFSHAGRPLRHAASRLRPGRRVRGTWRVLAPRW
ncbi:MAG: hypothetical protein CAPSK01_001556 [Candidatus Accumulibacter vicinus]|uniref:Uncharacterized protein n=1 Tax=Candidatus Accumulibacter vicinus TaxID=2954382 RepID=A0A084Y1V8_9PROT|nr:MAG: hypothetical protein CAPSK01_001556 [Candidatus Accumulibacter vicinus]